VTLTSTAVSERFEAFGNLIRKKNSNPNSATRSNINHASSAELIQPDHDRTELKKSQRIREEIMKALLSPSH